MTCFLGARAWIMYAGGKNEEAMLTCTDSRGRSVYTIPLNPTPVVLFSVRQGKLASVNFAVKIYKWVRRVCARQDFRNSRVLRLLLTFICRCESVYVIAFCGVVALFNGSLPEIRKFCK